MGHHIHVQIFHLGKCRHGRTFLKSKAMEQ